MIGLIALSTVAAFVVLVSLSVLVWAAVEDGREDRRVRGERPAPAPAAVRVRRRPARPAQTPGVQGIIQPRAFANWPV